VKSNIVEKNLADHSSKRRLKKPSFLVVLGYKQNSI